MTDNIFQSYDYWFENQDEHKEEDNFGKEYYVYKIYDIVLRAIKEQIPSDGDIVLFGTNKCVSFNLLCEMFGQERCLGYDLYNPTNHPRVVTKNCFDLDETDARPIAFFHNDIGSFPTTPELKKHVQEWAVKHVIAGGVVLSRNNLNRAKYDIEGLMESNGFKNIMFKDILIANNIDSKLFDEKTIEGHMFSIRKK